MRQKKGCCHENENTKCTAWCTQVVGQASVIALQWTTCRTEKITASVCAAGAAAVFPLVKQLVLCRFR